MKNLTLLLLSALPIFGAFPEICERCWYEVPNSALDSVAQTPTPPGFGGPEAKMAWSGGAFDTRRNRLIVTGGGGQDYAGNEIYAFDVDSLKWFRIKDGADVYDEEDTLYAYYLNGGVAPDSQQPRPGYNYDQIEYDSISDNLYILGAYSTYRWGTGYKNVHQLNMSTLTWSHPTDVGPLVGPGSLSGRDPATGRIWTFINGWESYLGKFDPADSTWTDHGDMWTNGALEVSQNAAFMPPTRRLISFGAGSSFYWDTEEEGFIPAQELSPTDCDSLMAPDGPGFDWSPVDNKMVGWIGGTKVYTMDTNYTCEEVPAAAGNTVEPDSPVPFGTFGRWRYVPKHNVFIVVNSTTGSVYFYRHSSMSGDTTPTVEITEPEDNHLTNQGSIAVTWKVNGVIQSSQTSEVLELEGANLVIRCSGSVCDTVTVFRDQTPPVVVITFPGEDTTVFTEPVLVQFSVDGAPRSRTIPLEPGLNVVIIDTLDAAGNRGADTIEITYEVPEGAPSWPFGSHLSVSNVRASSMRISWTPAVDDSGVSRYRIYRDDILIDSVPGSKTQYSDAGLLIDNVYVYRVEAGDLRGNWTTDGPDSSFSTSDELPPHPETIAPPLDKNVASTIFAGASFLFNDTLPIQTGMAPDIIDTVRASVLRGVVKNRAGDPLPGVSVSVLGAKGYGSTVTRDDGEYDLMVNGGGYVTLNIIKAGYLPVHRQLDIPWQRYVNYPEVTLSQLDSASQIVSLDSGEPMQVFRASIVSDSDGTRQATLLIPTNTTGQKIYPDGTVVPLGNITLRATEYTVGENGFDATPADLPPTSAYTYAVEYSADEALEDGVTVQFSQPIYSYLENFVGFPVGWRIPSAYYDRKKGHWIPEPDGWVIKILAINGGKAEIEIDSSGNPADSASLADLGVSGEELEKLALLYSVGTSLWRVPTDHFSPWDFNCGAAPDPRPKFRSPKQRSNTTDKEDKECGSIIGCQSQVLGETFPITGTPYSLHYRSDRVKGRTYEYTLDIPLTDSILPVGIVVVQLDINIAGRKFRGVVRFYGAWVSTQSHAIA